MDGLWLIHFTGRTFKVTTTNHSSDPQTNLPYPSPTHLVQTDATLLANNSQYCQLDVTCLHTLLHVVAGCWYLSLLL